MMHHYIDVLHQGQTIYLMISQIQFFYIGKDEGKEYCMVYLVGKDTPLLLENTLKEIQNKVDFYNGS